MNQNREKSDFFSFRTDSISSVVQVEPELGTETERLIRGEYENIVFPVVFQQKYGKNLRDLLGTGSPGLYLISDKFKAILEENQLTGWTTFPVKIFDKKKNEITGYYGFSVIGRSGRKRYDKSKVIEKRHISEGPVFQYYKGAFIEKWGGTDFFVPEQSLGIIITQRSAEILKRNKLSNICLTNLANVEIEVDTVQMFNKSRPPGLHL